MAGPGRGWLTSCTLAGFIFVALGSLAPARSVALRRVSGFGAGVATHDSVQPSANIKLPVDESVDARGRRRLTQAPGRAVSCTGADDDVPSANSVSSLVQLAATASVVRLDPSRPFEFNATETLLVPPSRSLALHCCGATLTPCAACTLLNIQNGARLSLVDCNINVVLTMDASSTVRPAGAPINPAVGIASDNATEYQFMLHMGVLAGNGSLTYIRGSILTSCPVFDVFPYFQNTNTAVLGNDTSTSVLTLNHTAKAINLTAPVGYQGGHKQFVDTTIYCIAGPGAWNRSLLWLLLLLLLIPVCIVLAAFTRRRWAAKAPEAKLHGLAPGHNDMPDVVCGSSRQASIPSGASVRGSAADAKGSCPGTGSLSGLLREEDLSLGQEHLQVHEVIARGGFGLVQRGTWRNLPVAVKTIVFQAASTAGGSLSRAEAEASIAYSLTHPNIVATYSHELTAIETSAHRSTFKLVLIQELCNCGTLWSLIDSGLLRGAQGAPHLRRVHSILAQICAALRHIHSKRVTHADLNPANILCQVSNVSTEDEELSSSLKAALALDYGLCAVKVTDFGLSMRLDSSATHASNMNQGTPFYCAPETCEQSRLSPASDVYSLGVILWQLAHGAPPYQSVNGIATLHPRFGAFDAVLPRQYVDLGRACLQTSPEARPLVDDILKALDSLADEMGGGSYINATGQTLPSDVLAWPPGEYGAERRQQSGSFTLAAGGCEALPPICFSAASSDASLAPFSSTLNGDLRRLQLEQMG